MTTDWTFLNPWYDAFRSCVIQGKPTYSGSEMQVAFEWPLGNSGYPRPQVYLMIHLEEGNPENVNQLKRIREAIQLFTILSIVDNKAFVEQFSLLTQTTAHGERRYFPELNVYVCGAATDQQVAWSRLLEVSDPSPQFQRAIQTLNALGLEGTGKESFSNSPWMIWHCKCAGADVDAGLELHKSDGIETDLRRLFTAGASMIVQLSLTPDRASLVDIWLDQRQQAPMCVDIGVTIHDLSTPFSRDLTAGLVWTPIHSLRIVVDEENITSDGQATMNAGVLMNRVYQWSRVISQEVKISCYKVSKSVFAAIWSTVAVRAATTPIAFSIQSVTSEWWPWLVYAVCSTASAKLSLIIWTATLTEADLLSVADVVRCNYPHSKRQQQPRNYTSSQYGFVDILEGTTVWPIDFENGPAFVMPSSVRCRAWFKRDDLVEVVVPGFGLYQTRIGHGISEVSRDSEEQNTPKSSALSSLYVLFTALESVSLGVNLLELIGRNLRSLKLCTSVYSNDIPLNLSVLSAVCPELRVLDIYRFDVVVSDHNEALRVWPIKELTIEDSGKLADITLCLQNHSVRMARELEKLCLQCRYQVFDEEEKRDLSSHDGDFLSVTKEQFPIQSKAAMISVVNSVRNSNAIQRLNADVLRIVFGFASTPAQRSVIFCAT